MTSPAQESNCTSRFKGGPKRPNVTHLARHLLSRHGTVPARQQTTSVKRERRGHEPAVSPLLSPLSLSASSQPPSSMPLLEPDESASSSDSISNTAVNVRKHGRERFRTPGDIPASVAKGSSHRSPAAALRPPSPNPSTTTTDVQPPNGSALCAQQISQNTSAECIREGSMATGLMPRVCSSPAALLTTDTFQRPPAPLSNMQRQIQDIVAAAKAAGELRTTAKSSRAHLQNGLLSRQKKKLRSG